MQAQGESVLPVSRSVLASLLFLSCLLGLFVQPAFLPACACLLMCVFLLELGSRSFREIPQNQLPPNSGSSLKVIPYHTKSFLLQPIPSHPLGPWGFGMSVPRSLPLALLRLAGAPLQRHEPHPLPPPPHPPTRFWLVALIGCLRWLVGWLVSWVGGWLAATTPRSNIPCDGRIVLPLGSLP